MADTAPTLARDRGPSPDYFTDGLIALGAVCGIDDIAAEFSDRYMSLLFHTRTYWPAVVDLGIDPGEWDEHDDFRVGLAFGITLAAVGDLDRLLAEEQPIPAHLAAKMVRSNGHGTEGAQ